MASTLFYFISLIMVLVLYALFVPAADIVFADMRSGGGRYGNWMPLVFLLLVWMGAFIKARRQMMKKNLLSSLGWIMGTTSLVVVLLYVYLKRYV